MVGVVEGGEAALDAACRKIHPQQQGVLPGSVNSSERVVAHSHSRIVLQYHRERSQALGTSRSYLINVRPVTREQYCDGRPRGMGTYYDRAAAVGSVVGHLHCLNAEAGGNHENRFARESCRFQQRLNSRGVLVLVLPEMSERQNSTQ